MKKKQGGFGLIETLLSMLILSGITLFFTQEYLNYIEKRNASEFKLHTERVIEALQKYQYHKVTVEHNSPYSPSIWPANLDALMTDYPNQFWPMCSKADAKNGMCQRPDSIPWSTTSSLGYKIDFVGTPPTPKATLTFPLSSGVIDVEGRAVWANAIQRLPFIKLESNKDLSIQIGDPLMVQVYKEFLQRDGSTKLTNTWDVGGDHAIVNASGISVRNDNGTQRRLGAGVVKSMNMKHGDWIEKHSCPSGLVAGITVSRGSQLTGSWGDDFSTIGASKVDAIDASNPDYWVIINEYYATRKSDGRFIKLTNGNVIVNLTCN